MQTNWLVDLIDSPTPPREPVPYLIPHAGAGVSAVLALGRALADHLHPVAVRLPGRESLLEQEPITDLPTVANGLAEQIRAHVERRLIVLYGHSSGAVLAYETARRLPPDQVVLLVVSAQQAPGHGPKRSTAVWTLPDDEFFAQVVEDGYLPEGLLAQPEVLELVGPALRADYQAIDHHTRSLQAPEPIAVPIIAIQADNDDTVATDDIAAWATMTTCEWRLVTLPGGHNLLRDQATGLADIIHDGVRKTVRG
ncbi:MAG: thioesterase II family protein [Candidatus Dormibacteria bacterium]